MKKNMLSSSVHCSYYSSLQLILHFLHTKVGMGINEIETKGYSANKEREGYHNWLKSEILKDLMLRNFNVIRDFNNFFGTLKKLRRKADYLNEVIFLSDANEAFNKSNSINEILKENY
jgi:hypothetical protein